MQDPPAPPSQDPEAPAHRTPASEGTKAPGTAQAPHLREAEYLSAKEAAELLGVKLPTVYAYTSRGLIQSVPGGRGRSRRYRRRDLERLCARRDARAGHGPVAAGALRQGEPVLDSSITLISVDEGPIYRGRLAIDLARENVAFERVAEGLWSGSWDTAASDEQDWRPESLGLDLALLRELVSPQGGPLPVLSIVIPLFAAQDPGRFSSSRDAVLARARLLLRRCVALLALGREGIDPGPAVARSLAAPNMAAALGAAFSRDLTDAELRALNQALVLAADHELNASTFAARVAASTGADIYACIAAALATLSGPKHGGAADRVDALIEEAATAERVERVVHERQRRGEVIEGFGHPIYAPHPDPRGHLLMEIARGLPGASDELQSVLSLVGSMQSGGFGGPTIDVGLVAITRALSLPTGTATALFAIGRAVGWVAHAIEQQDAGYLVRPRARYREV